jgi:predicted HD superfamily hydrolase involved in NAD metabolism
MPPLQGAFLFFAGFAGNMANFSKLGERMFEEITNQLEKKLSPKRFKHCLGVSKTAGKLAEMYGGNKDKAVLAGLVHDCAREMPSNILLKTAEAFGIVVNDVERRDPMLLHAPVGAFIARQEYGVDDPEVCRAVMVHTTGDSVMSLLDNIVFLADYIEPGRSFPGVEKLRALAKTDLQQALLAAYDQTLRYLISERELVHPATLEGRNALLLLNKK